jgi:hypothetical protein
MLTCSSLSFSGAWNLKLGQKLMPILHLPNTCMRTCMCTGNIRRLIKQALQAGDAACRLVYASDALPLLAASASLQACVCF